MVARQYSPRLARAGDASVNSKAVMQLSGQLLSLHLSRKTAGMTSMLVPTIAAITSSLQAKQSTLLSALVNLPNL